VDEADRDDWVVAGVAQQLEPRVLVVLTLADDCGEFFGLNVQVGANLVQTGGGGVVERLVTPATDVEGETDLDVLLRRRARAPRRSRVAAAAGGRAQRDHRHRSCRKNLHPTRSAQDDLLPQSTANGKTASDRPLSRGEPT